MNTELAAMSGKTIGQSGESFSLLLANASAQPALAAKGSGGTISLFALPVNSEPEANEQPAEAPSVDAKSAQPDQAGAANEKTNWKPAIAPVLVLPIQLRTSNSAPRMASRDERSQMSTTTLAAKIAATVILPSATFISSAVVTSAPIAAQPAPSISQAASISNTARPAANDAVAGVGGSERDTRTQESDSRIAAQTQPSDGKISDASEDAAQATDASGTVSASAAANASTFFLPVANVSESFQESSADAPVGVAQSVDVVGQANSQTSSKAAQAGKALDPSTAKGGASVSTSDSAKSAAATPTSKSDAATHSNASNGDAIPKLQADAVQAGASTGKQSDSTSAQVQTIVAARANDHAPVSTSRAEVPETASRTTDQALEAQAAANAPAQGINAARVIQNMSESEMRVGMHSAEFGDISIRTSVSQLQMVAQISVDHSDLGKAISAHIPAMQEKLGGDLGVRATVEVGQSGMSFSSEGGSSQDRQMKSGSTQVRMQTAPAPAETEQQIPRESARSAAVGAGGYRLDIRA